MSEQVSEQERKVILIVLQHTLHRLNEFLDEKPADNYAGQTAEAVASEFVHWLAAKDGAL
jgi:hypothetical protein